MRFELLTRPDFVVFSTREFALEAGISVATASRQLARAVRSGALTSVTRGVWANTAHPFFHPLACVPQLLGNEQGYVSFLTALHLHDMVSQIPNAVHVATTGHARKLTTSVGTYEFFHLGPNMMRDGVVWSETRILYRLATPEKALLDTLYIATRKRRRFHSLPELNLSPRRFSSREFKRLLAAIENHRISMAVQQRFQELSGRTLRAS